MLTTQYIRSRNRAAAICLVSLAVFVPALVIPRTGDDLTVRITILFGSLAATLISAVWLIVRSDETRRLARLHSGKGVIARWTIDPARWEWFRGQSNEWDTREGVRPNDANLGQDPGNAGIDVVVTLDGILVGADFHPLEKDARITDHADWMEFYQVIPKPQGTPMHLVVRLPLQPGKESLASDIRQAYQRVYNAAAGSGRRVLLYLGVSILLGMPAITGLIWLIARITGWVKD